MARGINKVILLGNLASDPEFRMLPSGNQGVATVSLATNESYRDQQGTMKDRVEWHRLVFWGRLAEIARDYLRKGTMVYVEGKIRTRSYDDQQGIKRYVTEIQVAEMQMLSSKQSGTSEQTSSDQFNRYNNTQNAVSNQQHNANYSQQNANYSQPSFNPTAFSSPANQNVNNVSMPTPDQFKINDEEVKVDNKLNSSIPEPAFTEDELPF